MNTFRAILTGRGWSKNRIKESLKQPSRMKSRDREQFELAESMDRVSSVNQDETHKASMVFEDVLYMFFDSIGVRYRTQDQLMAEQKKAEGRAIITPDLLMIDDVRDKRSSMCLDRCKALLRSRFEVSEEENPETS